MVKILLIEDNEMNRDMLSRRLTKRGYEVVVAVDGRQGVEKARSERPALVLMDMSLPVLDGWEATRELRADPSPGRSRSSRSLRMPWRATARKRSRRGATTSTRSPSSSSGSSARSRRSSSDELP